MPLLLFSKFVAASGHTIWISTYYRSSWLNTFICRKKGMSALSLKILLGMFALRLSVIVGTDAERENDPSECKPKKLCEVAT